MITQSAYLVVCVLSHNEIRISLHLLAHGLLCYNGMKTEEKQAENKVPAPSHIIEVGRYTYYGSLSTFYGSPKALLYLLTLYGPEAGGRKG